MSDYISREYLLDVLLPHSWHGTNKNIVPYNDRRGYRQRDREVREVIINAPSADVRKNKTGEWLRMSDLPEDKDDRYKCSNCGNVVHYSNGVNLYHFNSWCGRCGSLNNSLMVQLSDADMRGKT